MPKHARNRSRRPLGVLLATAGLCLAGLCLIASPAGAQLVWQPVATGVDNSLSSLSFPSDQVGYAAGSAGVVLKTTDAGATWSTLTTGAAGLLQAVDFLTPDRGVAVGDDGVAFWTTDGGASWTEHSPGLGDAMRPSALLGVHMFDQQTAVAVGLDGDTRTGVVARTTDGGASWTRSHPDSTLTCSYLAFLDGSLGYLLGQSTEGEGMIFKTTDAGLTWTRASYKVFDQTPYGIHLLDASRAIAVGTLGGIIATTDGGASWNESKAPVLTDLLDVDFHGERGIAVGSLGGVVTTTDGGATWSAEQLGTTAHLRSVRFTPSGDVTLVAGFNGTIFRRAVPAGVIEEGSSTASGARVTPNPSAADIRISVPEAGDAIYRVTIYDMMGRRAIERTLTNGAATIARGELAPGHYLYVLSTDGAAPRHGSLIVE